MKKDDILKPISYKGVSLVSIHRSILLLVSGFAYCVIIFIIWYNTGLIEILYWGLVLFGVLVICFIILLVYSERKIKKLNIIDTKIKEKEYELKQLKKEYSYFCNDCFYQTNTYTTKCPKCKKGKMKKTGEGQ